MHHQKRGEDKGPGLACRASSPTPQPGSSASLGQQCWYTQMGQIPKSPAISPSKGQVTSVTFVEEEDLRIQVSITLSHVFSVLDICCFCDILSPDGNTFLQWVHSYY